MKSMDKEQFIKELLNLEYELSRFATKLTKSDEKARDLLQETFLKVLSNRDKYREEQNFRAWVYTILKNQFINDYRKEKKNNTCDYLTSDCDYLNNIYSINSEEIISYKEIKSEIDNLDNIYRYPFKLLLSGYKYEEIKIFLGLKIGTVKSRIFEARKILTKNIERYETVF